MASLRIQPQPSQGISSYWDDDNMGNWGVQKKAVATVAPATDVPPSAAPSVPEVELQGKTIPTPAHLPWIAPHLRGLNILHSTSAHCPVATIEKMLAGTSIEPKPYLPPHLTAIRDSTILSDAQKKELLGDKHVRPTARSSTSSGTTTPKTFRHTVAKESFISPPTRPQSRSTNDPSLSSAPQSRSTSNSSVPSRPFNSSYYQPYNRSQDLPPPETDHAGASILRSWLNDDLKRPKSAQPSPQNFYYSKSGTPNSRYLSEKDTKTPTGTRYGDKGYVPPAVRPQKSMDTAQRMIYHDLGIKMPSRRISPEPGV